MDHKHIKLKNTKRFGKGVFATAPIKKGTQVAIFDGPFFDDEFDEWTPDLLNHAIQCGKKLWRDSKGLARYFNHSCEPNCGIKGKFRLVAMRDISKGEALTWDYEMTEKSDWWKMKCKCGTASCRKVIGNYSRMPKAIRRKYQGYISDWITEGKGTKRR